MGVLQSFHPAVQRQKVLCFFDIDFQRAAVQLVPRPALPSFRPQRTDRNAVYGRVAAHETQISGCQVKASVQMKLEFHSNLPKKHISDRYFCCAAFTVYRSHFYYSTGRD